MSESLSVSGRLQSRDLKQLVRISRSGTVGPTALYYAGLTAPFISASVALLFRDIGRALDWTPFIQLLASANVAAFAAIAWYIIFMRWSYRNRPGRGTELTLDTQVTVSPDGLCVRRGAVETRVRWDGIRRLTAIDGHTAIFANGADALIIPDEWFGRDPARRTAFKDYVTSRIAS
ncbi:MAG: YcxB family protein [Acidobacteria bacterium]|nr:YcxB family protein [Acidobacteriota bacterium]